MVVPNAGGSPLVVANANGSTTGYHLTGQVAWDIDGATGEVAPSPAWWNGRIYAVNAGSGLYCHQTWGKPKKLWEYSGRLSDTASPVAVNGLFFMTTGNGYFSCLDAANGKDLWIERVPGGYASLIASGDRIYTLGRNGSMQIVAAERTYRQIATCILGDSADATPAMCNGRLYIRSSKWLWCLGSKTEDQR